MMNIQELATAAEHQLDVKITLINNQALGLYTNNKHSFWWAYLCRSLPLSNDFIRTLKDLGWIHVI